MRKRIPLAVAAGLACVALAVAVAARWNAVEPAPASDVERPGREAPPGAPELAGQGATSRQATDADPARAEGAPEDAAGSPNLLQLLLGGRAAGTLVDVDGKPIAGANVELQRLGQASLQVTTDAQGRFDFGSGIQTSGDYVAVAFDGIVVAGRQVSAAIDGELRVVVRSDLPRAELEVAARGPDGGPATEVVVEVRWPGSRTWVVTDPDGIARTRVLAGPVAIVARGQGWSAATGAVVPPSGAAVALAPTPGVVAGRVVAPDGTPAVTTVELRHVVELPHPRTGGAVGVDFNEFVPNHVSAPEPDWIPAANVAVKTAEDGRFRFENVGNGAFVVVPLDDEGVFSGVVSGVKCRTGDLDVRLVVGDLERMLEGWTVILVGPTGVPGFAAGRVAPKTQVGEVVLRGPSGRSLHARLFLIDAPTGRLRVAAFPMPGPGVYDAEVRVVGYRPARMERLSLPASDPVRVTVEPSGGVLGTLLCPELADTGAHVLVGTTPAPVAIERTPTRGLYAFAVGDLDPGRHPVRVVPRRGGRPWAVAPTEVEIRGTEIARLDLVAVPGAAITMPFAAGALLRDRVTVRAVDAAGRVAAETTVTTRDLEALPIERWLEPEASLDGLLPGRYTLEGTWDGRPMTPRTIDLAAGATAVVALPLK